MTSTWVSLEDKLRAFDGGQTFSSAPTHPVSQLASGDVSAKPFAPLLIEALQGPLEAWETEEIARCLTEKGISDAVPVLIDLMMHRRVDNDSVLWVIGNAISTIGSREHLDGILAICKDSTLGEARQMVLGHAAAYKKQTGVFDVLVSLLEDSSVRGHAIEALGRYGDPKGLAAIRSTSVDSGLYEAKAKETAVRRLERKLDR